jgi:hypothetical protein
VSLALLASVVGPARVDDAAMLLANGIRAEAPAATELTVRSAM